MNTEFASLLFLNSGKKMENLKQKILYLMSEQDIKLKEMTILVYKINKSMIQGQSLTSNYINIIFRLQSVTKILIIIKKIKREEALKKACIEFASENRYNFKSLIFKYEGKEIDVNKKFDDFANKNDKNCFGMTLLVCRKNSLIINFFYKNNPRYTIECNKDDKIKNVFKDYATENKLNLNNLSFQVGIIPIPLDNKTFNQLDINYDPSTKMNLDKITKDSFNNEDSIDIIVNNIIDSPISCFKKNKRVVIILSIAIIVILLALLIILLLKRKEPEIIDETDTTVSNSTIVSDETDSTISDSTIVSDETDSSVSDSTIVSDETDSTTSDSTIEPKICDEGYFLPYDDKTFQDCQKCSLEGCIKCNGTYKNNECISCGKLESVYLNNKIIKCNNTCETGDEEKCLTCYEDKPECKTCNIGYKLIDGKCKADYFIKVKYYSISDGEELNLINSYYISRVNLMIIDKEKVKPISKYNFPKEGYHTIYYKFTKLIYNPDASYLFSGLNRIFSVSFSDFNEYIPDISFEKMFSGCKNLTSVDLSKVTIDLNVKVNYMFDLNISVKFRFDQEDNNDAVDNRLV